MKGIEFKKIKIPNSFLFELEISNEALYNLSKMAIGNIKFIITPIGNKYDVDVKQEEAPNQIYGIAQQIPDDDIDDSETEPPTI